MTVKLYSRLNKVVETKVSAQISSGTSRLGAARLEPEAHEGDESVTWKSKG
jgi:hypothetical protein